MFRIQTLLLVFLLQVSVAAWVGEKPASKNRVEGFTQQLREMFAFMEAADESERRGGQPVLIAEVLEKARDEAHVRLSQLQQ